MAVYEVRSRVSRPPKGHRASYWVQGPGTAVPTALLCPSPWLSLPLPQQLGLPGEAPSPGLDRTRQRRGIYNTPG